MADDLRRCLTRKRVAFRQFRQWYWESFDDDMQVGGGGVWGVGFGYKLQGRLLARHAGWGVAHDGSCRGCTSPSSLAHHPSLPMLNPPPAHGPLASPRPATEPQETLRAMFEITEGAALDPLPSRAGSPYGSLLRWGLYGCIVCLMQPSSGQCGSACREVTRRLKLCGCGLQGTPRA